jgi:hypothetical protein
VPEDLRDAEGDLPCGETRRTSGMSVRGLDLRGHTLAFAAVVEVVTGLVLMLNPALVAELLLGQSVAGAGVLLGRCFGIALFAQGLACWPNREQRAESSLPAFRSMLSYNTLIALYLAYLGVFGQVDGRQVRGVLLWPAIALHGIVAVLLLWTWRARRPEVRRSA